MEITLSKLVVIILSSAVGAISVGYYLGVNSTEKYNTVIPVNDLLDGWYSEDERDARCSLASLYRVIDVLGWSEQIYNHISLRVPGKEEHFLINPYGLHYSEITASNLVKVNINGDIIDPGTTNLGISTTGYVIHSAVHEARKDIKCIIHVHTPVGTAVSSMKFGLLSSSIYSESIGDISYHDFQGTTTDKKERQDIVDSLGPTNKAFILRNHGLIALGETLESAYQLMHDMMAACQIQVASLSAGIDNIIRLKPEEVRKSASISSHTFKHGELEYECIMRELDRKGYNTGYNYRLQNYTKQN